MGRICLWGRGARHGGFFKKEKGGPRKGGAAKKKTAVRVGAREKKRDPGVGKGTKKMGWERGL